MNRFILIVMAVTLAAAGCKAEFKPTGVKFKPGGVPEDSSGSRDTEGLDLEAPPPDTRGSRSCEDLWLCVLDKGCALAPAVDDSVCLKQCVGEQDDEHVLKFLDLKECAAGACATEPDGDAVIQCSYQYCAEQWIPCVSAGDGDKTCGDMHRCLREDCGPDYTSAHCVSNCLRDGDEQADQFLAFMIACSEPAFYVSQPLECSGALAACYAGSNQGKQGCQDTLMCELDCYSAICPDPNFCTDSSALIGCFMNCLWGLAVEDLERMYPIQQCMVAISHEKLLEEDHNVYSYCALQAHLCLDLQTDEWNNCGNAVNCLKDNYNYFPGLATEDPLPFWVSVRECLDGMKHSHKEPLSAAIWCLHEKYEGAAADFFAPWAECKLFCP